MERPDGAFHAFELDGWQDPAVADVYDRHLSRLTCQSVDALMEAAGVGPGVRLLDLASGAGQGAAAAVALGAQVTGADFSATQVALARERVPGARFEQADAGALPFDDGSFDALTCAFGLCHFPDPARAAAQMRRVLRPGGRLALTVWDVPERALGFGAVWSAIRTHGSLDTGLPEGPGFFLFSEPARGEALLREAGFTQIAWRIVPQWWRLSDADELFRVVTTGTVRSAATLRAQSAEAREAIRAALRREVERFAEGDAFAVPTPSLLYTARRP